MINAVSGIGGTDDGCGSELGDCNVVRMPVASIRTKGHDDVRLNAPDMRNNGADCILGLDSIDGTVGVAEEGDLTDTKHRGRGSQLRFTSAANFNRIARLSE
jgi:hypothetical protein